MRLEYFTPYDFLKQGIGDVEKLKDDQVGTDLKIRNI